MAVRLRDLLLGLKDLRLGEAPVIVHSSLKAFGPLEDGVQTVVSALAAVFPTVIVPTFTYKTMITPLIGPENNAMFYGTGENLNRMAEFFTPNMPADPLMGIVPEALRCHPRARRSNHPLLSFAGINAGRLLAAQNLAEPLAPLEMLEKQNGWAVLLGVNHTVNTSIHYAERLAGRRTFIRWALTPKGVRECPNFPGCSAGFDVLAPLLEQYTRQVRIGEALVQAVPLKMLFKLVVAQVRKDPLALLCQEVDCPRCGEIRGQGIRN